MNTSDAHAITVGGDPITPNPAAALLWLDVETTGLDPNTCSILEIGAICTSLDANTEYGRTRPSSTSTPASSSRSRCPP